jgi:antirestriction protein ArdC
LADTSQRRGAPLLRYYTVFNVEQCEGIEAPSAAARAFEPIAECERIVSAMPKPPRIEHHGAQAFYRPSSDTVVTPRPELFDSPALYYSVLFHELTHYAESWIMPSGLRVSLIPRRVPLLVDLINSA